MEALIINKPVDAVAVFVVTFDAVGGNMIEWCLPNDIDLQGIEYKAMPSGSHRVVEDFVYFRHLTYFGVAAFHRISVQSEVERGARMKSVGLLSTTYYSLHRCLPFLEKQVQLQLQEPGNYLDLHEFFKKVKATLPSNVSPPKVANIDVIVKDHGDVAIEHGSDVTANVTSFQSPELAVENFIRYFGDNVFVLWKLMLLRKRILFFSPPPIGTVCYRVHCCCLVLCGCEDSGRQVSTDPMFYVNIADIPLLETQVNYVGCTTERVFEAKTALFDVYVSNNNVACNNNALKNVVKPNSADHARLELLEKEIFDNNDASSSNIMKFANFFRAQNAKLFQMLYDGVNSVDGSVGGGDLKRVGLDAWFDRDFVTAMAEAYGFDIVLTADQPPCCSMDYCSVLVTTR